MYAKVDIIKNNDTCEIIITQNKSILFKIIVWMITLIILPAAILFVALHISSEKDGVLLFFAILVFLGAIIFIYKYNRSIYQKEKLVLTNKTISYSSSFLGLGKYIEFKRKEIKRVKYIGYDKHIEHELKITGDALNFDNSQKEINYLNQEGTMLMLGEYTTVRFGINVDQEDAEELIRLIK